MTSTVRKTGAAVVVCAALAGLLAGPAARAQEGGKGAGALFQEGNQLFDRGDFPAALARFQAAYQVREDPRILMNIALCQEKTGDLPAAAHSFERFLAAPGAVKYPARQQAVQSRLQALQAVLGVLVLTCQEPGAMVHLDGAQVGQGPLERRVYLKPGIHQVAVVKEGFTPLSEEASLGAGESRELDLRLAPVPSPGLPPGPSSKVEPSPEATKRPVPLALEFSHAARPPSVHRSAAGPGATVPLYKRWWFWTAVGVAVAGATTAGVLASQLGGSDRLPGGELGSIDLDP